MAVTLDDKLVVAISSRALFNLEEENAVFEGGDATAYMQLQLDRVEQAAKPGIAFSLIKKLLAFNTETIQRVEVVILSRNDPVSGMRIFRSGKANDIKLERGVFTQGSSPFRYLRPLRAHLFLSANADDVREALAAGFPSARVLPESVLAAATNYPNEVRIAFDGDAVLFSDEAEQVFQSHGLDAFQQHESSKALQPLPEGPFKPLLAALHRLQQAGTPQMRIRTALVTARSAPAHERAIRTLLKWDIRVDEAMFLGGLPKGEFLREFEPDFFFDDQTGHVAHAAQHGIPSGHVASGVSNTKH
ncbi:5'-nucleotidase [Caenimonas koreensis]|uniref:5'-nucleotidase n=1 Tax=Caenimonas koreensis DSM 17982 TaxID=1121255 RepID=A0A844BBC6_9BURK|nr:5'-nucleotidase [Caenimonas koreensis]MRD48866.1 5'-nucleotidase [Caenimonas koreensis DSM 17982]